MIPSTFGFVIRKRLYGILNLFYSGSGLQIPKSLLRGKKPELFLGIYTKNSSLLENLKELRIICKSCQHLAFSIHLNGTSYKLNRTSGYQNRTCTHQNHTSGYQNRTCTHQNHTSGHQNCTSGHQNQTCTYQNRTCTHQNHTSGHQNRLDSQQNQIDPHQKLTEHNFLIQDTKRYSYSESLIMDSEL